MKVQGQNAIRPPWTDLANFYEKCTACNGCIDACETQILKRGAGGFPEVDFMLGKGECTFCQACVKACEADVFRAVTETPWLHKVEIQSGCLPSLGVECRSCEDSCEARAIKFRRQLGGISSPQVLLENCNGCGACLSTCPTQAVQILALS